MRRTRRGQREDDQVSTILGISCDFHDAAACLVIEGMVVAAAEQERFSRRKHDASLPVEAVAACLATAELSAEDVDVISFYEKPLTIVDRYLRTRQRIGPRGLMAFSRDAPMLVRHNLMAGHRLQEMMRTLGARSTVPVCYVPHHLSHASAAFFPSPFEHAAVLTVDGIGEWATASVGRGANHTIEITEELRYPDSLGLLYSYVTAYCGFTPNDDEYKVMGLAPYGEPRFRQALEEFAQIADDGSVQIDARSLRWYTSLDRPALRRSLGGAPRDPSTPVGRREADLAASIQALTEDALLRMARHAHDATGETNLCLAGGVALNCVANGRILRESPFRHLWIQPAAGDSGSAVGAALALWHDTKGRPRTPSKPDGMSGGFLGPRVLPDEVAAWVSRRMVRAQRIPDEDALARTVARRLAAGDVVGWFKGRMEFGPRALGHRSILADPRSPTVRARLNSRVKGRESFRPFAPAILAEHCADWFEMDVTSPYMLIVAKVRDHHLFDIDDRSEAIHNRAGRTRSAIPACTHVDGTARVQTVDAATNVEFHRLLEAFHRLTGCPILLNTSFNVAGEPIVATPDDALDTAIRAAFDLLVVEDHLIEPIGVEHARMVGEETS